MSKNLRLSFIVLLLAIGLFLLSGNLVLAGDCTPATNCKASCDTTKETESTDKCTDAAKPKCCMPKAANCDAANCKASCDTAKETESTAKCTDAAKPKCCIAKSGDQVKTSGDSSFGGGTSVDLGSLSPVKFDASPAGVAGFIGKMVNAVLGVVGALALLMFVYGGVYLLSSAGASEKVKKGKDVITWSVIGIAVIMGSYILSSFIITGLKGEGGNSGGGDTDNTSAPTCVAPAKCTATTCQNQSGADLTKCISDWATANGQFCEQQKCPNDDAHVVCCQPKACETSDTCLDSSCTAGQTLEQCKATITGYSSFYAPAIAKPGTKCKTICGKK